MARKQLDTQKLLGTSSLTPATYPSQKEMDAFMQRMMLAPEASTESVDPRYAKMDTWSSKKMLAAFAEGQLKAIAAVYEARPQIEKPRMRSSAAYSPKAGLFM